MYRESSWRRYQLTSFGWSIVASRFTDAGFSRRTKSLELIRSQSSASGSGGESLVEIRRSSAVGYLGLAIARCLSSESRRPQLTIHSAQIRVALDDQVVRIAGEAVDGALRLSRILFKYEFGEDPREVFNMRPFYDQVTVPALRDAAVEYLNTNRYVKVTLIPESR
jgi:hypothetical protein